MININNRKLINEILDKEGIKDKEAVIKEIDKLDKLEENEIKNNLKRLQAENILKIFKKPESFFKKYESYREIEELKKYCKVYGAKVEFRPNLARGLSYYNGSVFEIKTKEIKETVAAGGSYLINGVQSTGAAFGLERTSQLTKTTLEEDKALIISIGKDNESIRLSEELRNKGISCSVMFGKISKALEYSNSYSIPYTVFLGEEEAKKKKLKLRNMRSGKEEFLSLKDVIEKLKN